MSLGWTRPDSEAPVGRYLWGGFTVASNLELPRLFAGAEDADVAFTWRSSDRPALPGLFTTGRVPLADGRTLAVGVGREGDRLRYDVEDVGSFVVEPDGIDLSPAAAADPMRAEHTLVNAVLPIWAGLRGTVCLHAAAVARGGRAIVLAGPRGVGKSTAAHELVRAGWTLVADDAVVLRRSVDGWLAYPAARTVRLAGAAAPGGWDNVGKTEFLVPTTPEPSAVDEMRLLLREEPTSVGRGEVFRSLCAIQSGWPWVPGKTRRGLGEWIWALCSELGDRIRATGWTRDHRMTRLDMK